MKYHGSCHCGAVRFAFTSPEISVGVQCNCSICIRKNAIMSRDYIRAEDFDFVRGRAALSVYHWGDGDVNHYFCKHCGIYPFSDLTGAPGKYRVNLGCVEGLNPRALKIEQIDGKSL